MRHEPWVFIDQLLRPPSPSPVDTRRNINPSVLLLLGALRPAVVLLYLDPTMAATQQIVSPQTRVSKHFVAHPLCPLTASEISNTAHLVRSLWPSNIDLLFKVITLEEPQKRQLVPYLDAEHAGRTLPHIDRKAFVAYYLRNTVSLCSVRRWWRLPLSMSTGQISRSYRQLVYSDRRDKCPSGPPRARQRRLCRDPCD